MNRDRLTKHTRIVMRTDNKDAADKKNIERHRRRHHAPPPDRQPPDPPQQTMKEEEEREFDQKQGHREEEISRRLDSQAAKQQLDKLGRDDCSARGDIVLLVEVRDVDVAGCSAGDERDYGQEEEAVVDGYLASLNDADICSTDSEGDGDSKEDSNARLHPIRRTLSVSW